MVSRGDDPSCIRRTATEGRYREYRSGQERSTPSKAQDKGRCQCQRTDQVADRAHERPSRHVVLVPFQVDVHQRRLRQTDECPRRRKEDDPRDQQNGEALAHRHERKRCRERYAAADHQQPSIPHVAENAKKRLDKAGQNAGNAEQQSDLHVRKVEVAPDEGPRGAPDAIYQLVEELDGE